RQRPPPSAALHHPRLPSRIAGYGFDARARVRTPLDDLAHALRGRQPQVSGAGLPAPAGEPRVESRPERSAVRVERIAAPYHDLARQRSETRERADRSPRVARVGGIPENRGVVVRVGVGLPEAAQIGAAITPPGLEGAARHDVHAGTAA